MIQKQISVFLENKKGRLAEVTALIAREGINIRALALADTADFGVLRLIVNDNETAQRLLKDHGYTVGVTEVVAVEVEDQPGGLHQILDRLIAHSVCAYDFRYFFRTVFRAYQLPVS
jgi:hypothetical protein